MDGETPGPDPQELQPQVESTDSTAEVVQGLRDRIEDPADLIKFSKEHDVKSGKWGSGATEALEAFHEKYSQWPGTEEEDRQIKEYLGFGKGSVWETKAHEAYKTMFPGQPLEEENWKKAAKLVKRELKDSRLEEYERHKGWSADDKKESVELSVEPEKIESIRANGETRGKEREDNDPNEDSILVDDEKRIYGVFDGMGGSDRPAEASAMAAKVIGENIQNDSKYSSPEDVRKAVHKAMEKADKEIHKKVGDGQTTATIAKIWEQGDTQYLV